MASLMTRADRLRATIARQPVDRPAVALWRHFPVDDQDPDTLAASVLAYQAAYDFDWVKVTPASSYSVRDWGVSDEWRGDAEGTRAYTGRVIEEPRDWLKLERLSPRQGALGEHLRCLEKVVEGLDGQVPVIATVFSPLSLAKHLAGQERLIEHLHRAPVEVQIGLKALTETTVSFVEAAAGTGIAGIFYALQHASYTYFDRAAYGRFGEVYDHQILQSAQGLWLNVLHLHGERLMFDLARDYPVQIVNWHDRHTPPSLAEGLAQVRGAVCGGLRRSETLVLGAPDQVQAEALEAVRACGRQGVVIGAGCVVPILAPRANLLAARAAADLA